MQFWFKGTKDQNFFMRSKGGTKFSLGAEFFHVCKGGLGFLPWSKGGPENIGYGPSQNFNRLVLCTHLRPHIKVNSLIEYDNNEADRITERHLDA